LVALAGMHTDTREEHAATLRALRVRCLRNVHEWQGDITHVVVADLQRSEKTLAAMAAGAWLVGQQWLADSRASGQLLDPAPYEVQGGQTKTGEIADGKRKRRGVCRVGAVLREALPAVWQSHERNCRGSLRLCESLAPPTHALLPWMVLHAQVSRSTGAPASRLRRPPARPRRTAPLRACVSCVTVAATRPRLPALSES
jgi:hypothetical protein